MITERLFRDEAVPPLQIEAVLPPEESPSPLAGYVLTEMSADLSAVREGQMSYAELRAKQEVVLDSVADQIAANEDDEYAALITQMDLGFMLGGYIPAEQEGGAYNVCPPRLLALLDQQAETFGIPERLDFELIIDANVGEMARTGQIRTFTDQETPMGRAERDFYVGHFLAEPHVRDVANQLTSVIEEPASPANLQRLQQAAGSMQTFQRFMTYYHGITEAQFGGFRGYFNTYPPDEQYPNGRRNASGAFMPSVQLAELALRPPTDEHLVFLGEAMPYFPRATRPQIAASVDRSLVGGNVVDMLESQTIELGDGLDQALAALDEIARIARIFKGFRVAHAMVTSDKIPGVYGQDKEGRNVRPRMADGALREFGEPDILGEGATGSANFNVKALLLGSASRLLDVEDRIHALRIRKLSVAEEREAS